MNYLKWYLQTRRKVSYTSWMKNTEKKTKQRDLPTNFRVLSKRAENESFILKNEELILLVK